jgi:O-antigen/teichoic acid export membrane protein
VIQGYLRRLRADDLLRNSFYLLLATATMSALGFVFWLLAARLYTAVQIGGATSLLSSLSLISYLGLFGLNTTAVRFLPSSRDPNRDINAGIAVVGTAGLLFGAGFVLLLPVIAPDLGWLRHSPAMAVAFCAMAALSTVNLFTDSVFIAARAAKYNVLIDGVLQGGVKVLLPVFLVPLGAFGLVSASGIAAGLAVVASLAGMARVVGYRPRLMADWQAVRATANFSAASYAASVFNLVPVVVLPLVVLNLFGAASAGYYFMAFQIANLLNAVAYAICQSLLAEGSYDGVDLRRLVARSVRILGGAMVPAVAVLAVAARPLLRVFGPEYSAHAGATLSVLAVGALGVSAYCWVGTLLKFTRQLRAMIAMNVVYATVIVGLAVMMSHQGLVGIAVAWSVGNTAAAVAGGVALLAARRRRTAVATAARPEPVAV